MATLDYMKQKKLQSLKKLVHAQNGILHGEKETLHSKEIFYITTSQIPRYVYRHIIIYYCIVGHCINLHVVLE